MKQIVVAVVLLTAVGIFAIPSRACDYVVGDVNGNGYFTGMDVVYAVNIFSGGPPPPYSCECPPGSGNVWFVAGDVNASCTFSGLDVTYMVRFFKGGNAPIPCPSCPPTPLLKSKMEVEAK
ncbi:MAG TPA: hypothetical protein DEO84_11720 [candidate division Zixibacteria bacterium]|jgi:hypothetical protein|nr:hypothetical protein [candidate division Zixibacteria bacterium]HBZ01975.1 hypothetical protein [candidate division Zixibacteria bacterium]